MTFSHPEGDWSSLPALSFSDSGVNETVYMSGWHIHAPADHTVGVSPSLPFAMTLADP